MYLAAEAALQTLLAGATGFSSTTVVRDDWQILDIGATQVIIIEQGGDTLEADSINGYGSQGRRTQAHEIDAVLLTAVGVAEGGEDTAVQASKTTAEALANRIALYERLNGATNVQRAQVIRITRPQAVRRVRTSPDNPTHIEQRIRVRVITQTAWTPTEWSN